MNSEETRTNKTAQLLSRRLDLVELALVGDNNGGSDRSQTETLSGLAARVAALQRLFAELDASRLKQAAQTARERQKKERDEEERKKKRKRSKRGRRMENEDDEDGEATAHAYTNGTSTTGLGSTQQGLSPLEESWLRCAALKRRRMSPFPEAHSVLAALEQGETGGVEWTSVLARGAAESGAALANAALANASSAAASPVPSGVDHASALDLGAREEVLLAAASRVDEVARGISEVVALLGKEGEEGGSILSSPALAETGPGGALGSRLERARLRAAAQWEAALELRRRVTAAVSMQGDLCDALSVSCVKWHERLAALEQ